jgi:hypothetical protein
MYFMQSVSLQYENIHRSGRVNCINSCAALVLITMQTERPERKLELRDIVLICFCHVMRDISFGGRETEWWIKFLHPL